MAFLLQPVMQATGGQTAPKRATAGMETAAVTLWRASATVRLVTLEPSATKVRGWRRLSLLQNFLGHNILILKALYAKLFVFLKHLSLQKENLKGALPWRTGFKGLEKRIPGRNSRKYEFISSLPGHHSVLCHSYYGHQMELKWWL